MLTLDSAALIAEAEALYDAYQLDALPPALCRNSLDYYYLSIYPSLATLYPVFDGRQRKPFQITYT